MKVLKKRQVTVQKNIFVQLTVQIGMRFGQRVGQKLPYMEVYIYIFSLEFREFDRWSHELHEVVTSSANSK